VIVGCGQLMGQHIIYTLSQLTLIAPEYGNSGRMCQGTRAWSRLKQNCGVTDGQIPSLHRIVAKRCSWTETTSENGLCKFARETVPGQSMNDRVRKSLESPCKFDGIYSSQDIFRYSIINTQGVAQMVEVRKTDSINRKARIIQHNPIEIYKLCLTRERTTHPLVSGGIFWKDILTHEEAIILDTLVIRINKKKPRRKQAGIEYNKPKTKEVRCQSCTCYWLGGADAKKQKTNSINST
jgi:hypothetical protein